MKKLFIILISLLIANSAFAYYPYYPIPTSLSKLTKYFKKNNAELVKIPSYRGPFRRSDAYANIRDGLYKKLPIEVDALMAFPKKGEDPFPVVMFVHASGGASLFSNEWFKFNRQQARQLLKKGIAVMFVDNFNGRNVISAGADQGQVSTYSFYIDAFMTLEYLSKDPKINIKKVGITGWSRGGMISLMVAEKRLRDILVSKDLYFAAAQPRSPECGVTGLFRKPQPINETKMWYVHGKADDFTSYKQCV